MIAALRVLRRLDASRDAGRAATESGLQAHPLILLRLFFSRLYSCPIPAHLLDFRS